MLADQVDYVVGVDTHRVQHVLAVVVAPTGAVVAQRAVQATARGYAEALRFAVQHAPAVRIWAVEGAGHYGAGLARYLSGQGETVAEAGRGPRNERRLQGKDDPLDAVRAARMVLASQRLALPRAGQRREALRLLVVARRSAVDVRRQALVQLRAVIVTAPDQLRAELRGLPLQRLIQRCSRMRRSSLRERLARLQARLDTLAAQEAGLALATAQPAEAPGQDELAAVADRLEHVITTQPAAKSKALLRLLIDELQVNSRNQIQPTYRIVTPAVCATSEKVELNGALSNPLANRKDLQLKRLAVLKRELVEREGRSATLSRCLGRRQGKVLATVTSVLEHAGGPMRMGEIQTAVERVLGEVSRSSVREALSAHTHGADRRFSRIERGWYEMTARS